MQIQPLRSRRDYGFFNDIIENLLKVSSIIKFAFIKENLEKIVNEILIKAKNEIITADLTKEEFSNLLKYFGFGFELKIKEIGKEVFYKPETEQVISKTSPSFEKIWNYFEKIINSKKGIIDSDKILNYKDNIAFQPKLNPESGILKINFASSDFIENGKIEISNIKPESTINVLIQNKGKFEPYILETPWSDKHELQFGSFDSIILSPAKKIKGSDPNYPLWKLILTGKIKINSNILEEIINLSQVIKEIPSKIKDAQNIDQIRKILGIQHGADLNSEAATKKIKELNLYLLDIDLSKLVKEKINEFNGENPIVDKIYSKLKSLGNTKEQIQSAMKVINEKYIKPNSDKVAKIGLEKYLKNLLTANINELTKLIDPTLLKRMRDIF